MALNQNQFSMTAVSGQKDALVAGLVLPVRLTDTAKAGDALKLVAGSPAGGAISVAKVAAKTEITFGVLLHNVQRSEFVAGDMVEMGMIGTVVLLPMGEAVVAGQGLAFDPADGKYDVATAGQAITAIPLTDGATDDLVRCVVAKEVVPTP